MARGNHSFTEQDIHNRFNAIVGHTVADVDKAGVLAASNATRNKDASAKGYGTLLYVNEQLLESSRDSDRLLTDETSKEKVNPNEAEREYRGIRHRHLGHRP